MLHTYILQEDWKLCDWFVNMRSISCKTRKMHLNICLFYLFVYQIKITK